MSKVIKLKKGLDIKLNGEAEKVVQPAGKITSCALKPTDFRAMTPKLAVKESGRCLIYRQNTSRN